MGSIVGKAVALLFRAEDSALLPAVPLVNQAIELFLRNYPFYFASGDSGSALST